MKILSETLTNHRNDRRWALRCALAVSLTAMIAGACQSGGSSDDTSSGTTGAGAAPTTASGNGAGPDTEPIGGGVGGPDIDPDDLGPPSHGGTITFEQIGAPGWYPSRRDPAVGPCDAYDSASCCLAQQTVTSDELTPWDQDLIMTLRGPMLVEQLAVYQPGNGGSDWSLVSAWTADDAHSPQGVAFRGNGTEQEGFSGAVGTECLVDVSTAQPFPCGPGSSPYCTDDGRYWGWSSSKMIVLLATMPHATDVPGGCSEDTSGNWYDAPWIGLSLGELVRAGAFSSCHCYAKNPDEWWLGDGCGQFNVFEVVNDNNDYTNLGVFSTNFFGYAGYVGEGPCGAQCDVSGLADEVDLIDKSAGAEAATGAVANPDQGPGAAFRRPIDGYRYFVMLLDVPTRTVQLALIHPSAVPDAVAPLLPALPGSITTATIDAVRALRLPE